MPTRVINYYTEGVRKFQPRVCFETLGIECVFVWTATLKELQGLRMMRNERRNPFGVAAKRIMFDVFPQGFKANPGLEFANAFGVSTNVTSG